MNGLSVAPISSKNSLLRLVRYHQIMIKGELVILQNSLHSKEWSVVLRSSEKCGNRDFLLRLLILKDS